MVGLSFGEKTAVFDEKYQTSPIPNIIDQSKYHNLLKLTVDSGSSPRITLWSSFTKKKI
jgi:hypothetical protein